MNKNRKIIVLSICIVLILLIGLSADAFADNNNKEPMLKVADVIRNHVNNNGADKKISIGDFNGEPIYNDEFDLRYKKAVAMGSDTPYDDTIESIRLLKAEKQFADENNISVTQNEVLEYTNSQRDIVDNQADADIRNGFKAFISELGMSEDEYWTEYKLEENAKYLLHLEVVHYQEKNNIIANELENTPIQITNEAYQKNNIDFEME
ncbi:MAG TPA: hypothetical protein VEA58_06770 [Anaerovoracaceae bacterium]|nr:hypothetical protein [Anaerovoracaceae bacterium]